MAMGRPRGLKLNRPALDDRLRDLSISKTELAQRAGISLQQLSDMYTAKRAGASPKTAAALADAARCSIGTLFPETEGYVLVEVAA